MTRAFIIGNSHTHCLWAASLKRPEWYSGFAIHRIGTEEEEARHQHVVTLTRATTMVGELEPDVPLIMSIGGTFHNSVSLLEVKPDFDFSLEGEWQSQSQASLVPHRAIAGWFSDKIAENGSIKRLSASARSEVYLLSTPPPKQSNAYLADRASRRRDGGARGLTVRQIGFSQPELRLKFWKLEQALMKQWAQANGMIFISVPARSQNDDGFLARRYYGPDTTHANTEYGMVMLNQIKHLLAQRSARRSNG